MPYPFSRSLSLSVIIISILLAGCATPQQTTEQEQPEQPSMQENLHQLPSEMNRLVANPINNEIPNSFFRAMEKGTRTLSGKPGNNYWTQRANYDIDVELIPADTLVKGSGTVTYYNNSPDTLKRLYMELAQNLHKKGVQRAGNQEVTGGVNLHGIAVNSEELPQVNSRYAMKGFIVNGTVLYIRPPEAVAPGDSVTIKLDWDFKIPQQGADGRMGYSRDNLYFIGYWYPQMRVYDDVNGWFTDPFTGNAEFYHDFGNYQVDITAPEQWMVDATGILQNGQNVLQQDIYQRLEKAHQSDSVVNVVSKKDFGNVTKSTESGKVTWKFSAEDVRDFAFSVTKESMWDATRANVGDRDGDGQDEYTNINSIYRSSAPLWKHGARFTRDAIAFLSDFTDLHYPWPHMTSVEGAGIIGGGMEFPMMTVIGAYEGRPAQALYAVIAHELAHMWVPMQVSTNERRYSWMDEGTTTFNEDQAKVAYYPDGPAFNQQTFGSYLQIAGSDAEGPIMRWSDYQYNGFAFGIASYSKPASMLVSLRNMLGEDTFNKAYHTFLKRWRYKHPYPWDLFNTFEDVTGQDLDWFWRAWYYETWTLDQAVGDVTSDENGSRIIIEDHGQVPMPATVEITLADGTTLTRTIDVDHWLKGAVRSVITIDNTFEVTKVVIDPDSNYPDVNRKNNTWQK